MTGVVFGGFSSNVASCWQTTSHKRQWTCSCQSSRLTFCRRRSGEDMRVSPLPDGKTGKTVFTSLLWVFKRNSHRYQRENGDLTPTQKLVLVLFRAPLSVPPLHSNFHYIVFYCNKVKTQVPVFSVSPNFNGSA